MIYTAKDTGVELFFYFSPYLQQQLYSNRSLTEVTCSLDWQIRPKATRILSYFPAHKQLLPYTPWTTKSSSMAGNQDSGTTRIRFQASSRIDPHRSKELQATNSTQTTDTHNTRKSSWQQTERRMYDSRALTLPELSWGWETEEDKGTGEAFGPTKRTIGRETNRMSWRGAATFFYSRNVFHPLGGRVGEPPVDRCGMSRTMLSGRHEIGSVLWTVCLGVRGSQCPVGHELEPNIRDGAFTGASCGDGPCGQWPGGAGIHSASASRTCPAASRDKSWWAPGSLSDVEPAHTDAGKHITTCTFLHRIFLILGREEISIINCILILFLGWSSWVTRDYLYSISIYYYPNR